MITASYGPGMTSTTASATTSASASARSGAASALADDLARWLDDGDAHLPVGLDRALVAVARRARAAGVAASVVDVLGDPVAPPVARIRAFGRVPARLWAAERPEGSLAAGSDRGPVPQPVGA